MLSSGFCKKKLSVALCFLWNTIKSKVLFTAVYWLAEGLELVLRPPFRWNPCNRYKAYEGKFEVRNGALKGALKGKDTLNPISTEWDQILLCTSESPRLISCRHSGVCAFMNEVLVKKGARHMHEIRGIIRKLQAFTLNFLVVFLTSSYIWSCSTYLFLVQKISLSMLDVNCYRQIGSWPGKYAHALPYLHDYLFWSEVVWVFDIVTWQISLKCVHSGWLTGGGGLALQYSESSVRGMEGERIIVRSGPRGITDSRRKIFEY